MILSKIMNTMIANFKCDKTAHVFRLGANTCITNTQAILANKPKANIIAIFKLSLLGCCLICLIGTSLNHVNFVPFFILEISLLKLNESVMNVSDSHSCTISFIAVFMNANSACASHNTSLVKISFNLFNALTKATGSFCF